jgi:predicted nucleic acid-binding protein
MTVPVFLDSNILLYAVSKAVEDAPKREVARALMLQQGFGVSLQVLQEFYHVSRVKMRLRIGPEEAEQTIQSLLRRPLAVMGLESFANARRLCVRYQLRYWDAAIIAAAQELGAQTLYSEDLSHAQSYDGVRVVNPFLDLGAHSLPPSG